MPGLKIDVKTAAFFPSCSHNIGSSSNSRNSSTEKGRNGWLDLPAAWGKNPHSFDKGKGTGLPPASCSAFLSLLTAKHAELITPLLLRAKEVYIWFSCLWEAAKRRRAFCIVHVFIWLGLNGFSCVGRSRMVKERDKDFRLDGASAIVILVIPLSNFIWKGI